MSVEQSMSGPPIRVAVAGALGKMGSEAVRSLESDGRFRVAGLLTRPGSGQAAQAITHAPVFHTVETLLAQGGIDVWLDFTDARSVVGNIDAVVSAGVRPVIGSTGYTQADLSRWDKHLRSQGIGGMAIPNFAIGALLMMRFARDAARFFPKAEIVELHHDGKKDAPSGTSKRTAEAIAETTGQDPADTPIHSVRLPGLVAHQEVMFGGTGELLTIRHDSMARSSFMPGVLVACQGVMKLTGLTYGLEQLLW